jgi:hypothetical protein
MQHMTTKPTPAHDLVAVWEEHLGQEFAARNPDAPTHTMVADPDLNHVPTMTGGVGLDEVKRFYKYHMVPVNPPDMAIAPISRTVGTDSIVDEMIVKFTHDRVIDYLLPGIPPTGAAGGDCRCRGGPIPRWKAGQRTHLLGSGFGAGADRQARSGRSSYRRRRSRAESRGPNAAKQSAHGAGVANQRGQTALTLVDRAARPSTMYCWRPIAALVKQTNECWSSR